MLGSVKRSSARIDGASAVPPDPAGGAAAQQRGRSLAAGDGRAPAQRRSAARLSAACGACGCSRAAQGRAFIAHGRGAPQPCDTRSAPGGAWAEMRRWQRARRLTLALQHRGEERGAEGAATWRLAV